MHTAAIGWNVMHTAAIGLNVMHTAAIGLNVMHNQLCSVHTDLAHRFLLRFL